MEGQVQGQPQEVQPIAFITGKGADDGGYSTVDVNVDV